MNAQLLYAVAMKFAPENVRQKITEAKQAADMVREARIELEHHVKDLQDLVKLQAPSFFIDETGLANPA